MKNRPDEVRFGEDGGRPYYNIGQERFFFGTVYEGVTGMIREQAEEAFQSERRGLSRRQLAAFDAREASSTTEPSLATEHPAPAQQQMGLGVVDEDRVISDPADYLTKDGKRRRANRRREKAEKCPGGVSGLIDMVRIARQRAIEVHPTKGIDVTDNRVIITEETTGQQILSSPEFDAKAEPIDKAREARAAKNRTKAEAKDGQMRLDFSTQNQPHKAANEPNYGNKAHG